MIDSMFNFLKNKEIEEMKKEISLLQRKVTMLGNNKNNGQRKQELKERIMLEGSFKAKNEVLSINIEQYNATIDLIINYYLDGSELDINALKKELESLKCKRKEQNNVRRTNK